VTQVSTQAALRRELAARGWSYSKGQVSKLSRREGFPGGRGPWDPEACVRWLEANVRRKTPAPAARAKKAEEPSSPAPPAREEAAPEGPPEEPPAEAEEERDRIELPEAMLAALEEGTDPLAMTRVALQLQARRYAEQLRRDEVGARSADQLKHLLEESRTAEKAWLDLRQRQGELVERSIAAAAGAEIARRAKRFADNMAAQLGHQVEVWCFDEDFRALDVEVRRRAVREWVNRRARAMRLDEAGEVERLLGLDEGEEEGA